MPIADKVAAAHKINDLLKQLIAAGEFKLKYRITVEPQFTDERQSWERPAPGYNNRRRKLRTRLSVSSASFMSVGCSIQSLSKKQRRRPANRA